MGAPVVQADCACARKMARRTLRCSQRGALTTLNQATESLA